MWVGLGGAESIGWSRAADLELELVVRARAELCVELPSRMTSQRGKSGLFGDRMGIANRSGIRVASSRSHLSRLESTGIRRVAESQGGLGARRCGKGSPRRVFESKHVVFVISGARITAITSSAESRPGGEVAISSMDWLQWPRVFPMTGRVPQSHHVVALLGVLSRLGSRVPLAWSLNRSCEQGQSRMLSRRVA